ncbi:hypothetical protein DQ04_00271080 [Trypanosoma grayi]|uniref:hypothetical protein n=1 Tax=Trypanosoma grayi TaxID=71804 RepID=UPI0004F41E1E|nr:hypothetical protein DQ04_00271080 [Trypanosoma grayi]KEG14874.1 hypothetical protein DQ04_00271080 [Trypanosoma grayi]
MDMSSEASDFERFLSAFFPSHNGSFTSAAAVCALAEYTGVSEWEASKVMDMRQHQHSMGQMHMYAARLVGTGRTPSEERRRMTVMLPASGTASHIGKSVWGGDDSPSPSPVAPGAEQRRKICKQYRESGACTFGSRCLYHHAKPLAVCRPEPHLTKAPRAFSLGIMGRCMEDMQHLVISNRSPERSSKGDKREMLGVLPSSTNNYCSPVKSPKESLKSGTGQLQQQQQLSPPLVRAQNTAVSPAFSAMGGIVMVPLSLPNGEFYGYAPLPLHTSQAQISHP